MISNDLRAYVVEQFQEQLVTDVRMGLGYTAVQLEDGNVGLAYTFRHETGLGCSVFAGQRPLAGRTTDDIVGYLGSPDFLECSLGLALANAVVNRLSDDQDGGDILDMLQIRTNDRIGMVGYFGPLVKPLRTSARELLIFERSPVLEESVLPAEQAIDELPSCDIAVITSSALVLGTLDALLSATERCREVVLLGPSTPLLPSVFRPLGVTVLSGIVVRDPPEILRVVSEGGGTRFFGRSVRKVNLRV
jgi:uncharacterized protein (DUF4213/DUF364 family)